MKQAATNSLISAEKTHPRHSELLVFGEILWDMLPDGAHPGGASANVAVLAHSIGVDCLLATAVGDDDSGHDLLARLNAHSFPTGGVQQIQGAQTGMVDVALSGNGIPSYHIRENVAWDRIAITPALLEAAAHAKVFYYDTLAQRSMESRATLQKLIARTKSGCMRFFDVNLRQPWPEAGVLRESLARASVLKLNNEELPLLAGWLGLPTDEAGFATGVFTCDSVRAILLTKGAKGATLYESGNEAPHHVPPSPVEKIVDTVGAGDAFSAGFIAGCLQGLSYKEAVRHGSDLAARVCANAGAWLPREMA